MLRREGLLPSGLARRDRRPRPAARGWKPHRRSSQSARGSAAFGLALILVLLLFGIIAPFAAVRVRSRASSKRLIKEFRNVWWVRYAREKKLDDEEIADRLISYLDRLVDRHINKARGILPFNSILLAVFTFEANRFASARPYLLSPITGLLVSSVLCLSMFFVYWQRDVYASWSSEVDFSVQKVIKTSIKIEWAAWISLFCMLIGAVVIAIVEGDLTRYLCANL